MLAIGVLSACETAPTAPTTIAPPPASSPTSVDVQPHVTPKESSVTAVETPTTSGTILAGQSGVAVNLAAASAAPELETVADVLRYADRLRGMTNAELNAELSRVGDPGIAPLQQLRSALILMNTRVPAETARSLALLQRVLSSQDEAATPLKPLVKVLAARLSDQRRVEDALDRQTQAVREAQRRIEALNSRLEAMRAIERSLSPTPLPASPPPGARPPGM